MFFRHSARRGLAKQRFLGTPRGADWQNNVLLAFRAARIGKKGIGEKLISLVRNDLVLTGAGLLNIFAP